jgi:hypothetical protein
MESGLDPAFATTAAPVLPPPRAGVAIRLAAGLSGLLVLAVTTLFSLGTALAGVLGMGFATWRARRRGQPLSRFRLWLASALGTALLLAGLMIWGATRVPGDFVGQMQQAARAQRDAPKPEMVQRLERIFPQPPAAKAGTQAVVESTAFTWWILVMTFTMMWGMFSLLAATPAWAGTLLLGLAVKGRWPLPRRRY